MGASVLISSLPLVVTAGTSIDRRDAVMPSRAAKPLLRNTKYGESCLDEKLLQSVNLKLLVVFAVLMREQSVTRAAKKMRLSQPAVSHSLKGLRAMFGDALFTRTSQGIVPTLRARALYENLVPSLETIESTVSKHPYSACGIVRVETVARRDGLDGCPQTDTHCERLIGSVINLSPKERFHD